MSQVPCESSSVSCLTYFLGKRNFCPPVSLSLSAPPAPGSPRIPHPDSKSSQVTFQLGWKGDGPLIRQMYLVTCESQLEIFPSLGPRSVYDTRHSKGDFGEAS